MIVDIQFSHKNHYLDAVIFLWVMQIQEYNLHIQQMKGTEHFLADTVSRNPAGMCERDT
jgi:hypothetical protein